MEFECPRCGQRSMSVVEYGGVVFCQSCFAGVGGEAAAAGSVARLISVLPPAVALVGVSAAEPLTVGGPVVGVSAAEPLTVGGPVVGSSAGASRKRGA